MGGAHVHGLDKVLHCWRLDHTQLDLLLIIPEGKRTTNSFKLSSSCVSEKDILPKPACTAAILSGLISMFPRSASYFSSTFPHRLPSRLDPDPN